MTASITRRTAAPLLASCVLGCVAACASSSPSSTVAPTDAVTALPEGWASLIDARWTLDAGQSGYACARVTLAKDLWIGAFRSLTDARTHHVIVTLADEGAPDNLGPCARGNLDPRVLFATGSVERALTMPANVALHLRAGQVLHLGVHTVNTSNDAVAGVSGVLARTTDARDVAHEAEVVLAGAASFTIPPRALGHVVEASATVAEETQVFALSPVMHRLGSSEQVRSLAGASEAVLHDALFTFGEERVFDFAPTTLAAGSELHVRCTFDNVSSERVSEGAGAANERCLASVYRYPARGGDAYAWVR